MLENDLSGVLDSKYNPALWNLLWLLIAPVLWIYQYYWRQLAADRKAAEEQAEQFAARSGEIARRMAQGEQQPDPTVERIAELWRRYPGRWGIAGGWAIDLVLGRATREHADIEVAVLRSELRQLWEYLLGWQPCYALPGTPHRVPWTKLDQLEPPVHELHCEAPQQDVSHVEVLLQDVEGDNWLYRRDARVSLPLAEAFRETPTGIPYLAPEIVLLYKSKAPRARDEQDFEAALPALNPAQREWLAAALEAVSPEHEWLNRLRQAGG